MDCSRPCGESREGKRGGERHRPKDGIENEKEIKSGRKKMSEKHTAESEE